MRNKLLITSLIGLSIFAYGCGKEKNKIYISENKDTCQEILFTCPQFQEIFYDNKGCGCIKSNAQDNPEIRRLSYVIEEYLNTRIIDTKHDGVTLGKYIFLDGIEDYSLEVGTGLNYQIWAGMNEYYMEDNTVKTEKLFNGPVILDITETGRNYIINGSQIFDLKNKEAIKENFTEAAYNWIFNTEKNIEETTIRIEEVLRQEAVTIFGDNIEPVEDVDPEPANNVEADLDDTSS